ncbi:MAG: hypothetical protein DMG58_00120 [Acidobacteria bacterium]|nr:MAG: hypothetical protein DMG58_00120 [Acidobacteriota bacterium]
MLADLVNEKVCTGARPVFSATRCASAAGLTSEQRAISEIPSPADWLPIPTAKIQSFFDKPGPFQVTMLQTALITPKALEPRWGCIKVNQ